MALALLKRALLPNAAIFRNSKILAISGVRNHMNTAHKPGPYPRTEAERAAAAKKYGLSVEEYEPYPEDLGYGDYPKIQEIGIESKDPYYPYDNPEFKRNFNELFTARAEIMGEDRYNMNYRHRFSEIRQIIWFVGVMTGFITLYYILEDFKMGRPVTRKQYPREGPHYTFDEEC